MHEVLARSGELYPYYQMPRGFFRQTIDLGGKTEAVDPDLNQLGGTETANRLVTHHREIFGYRHFRQ